MSTIKIIERKGYEIFQLNRGRANPIENNLVSDIRKNLARAKADKNIRGIILTGNTDGFFTVGLDLKELYYYDEKQIVAFWVNWFEMCMELTKFPKPMIAAINGHSPAGGCVIAITCDYRMMAAGENYKIGLNEVAVGITVPEYIFQLYAFWIGKRLAYQNLMRGRLLTVEEALEINLIDEIHEMDALLPAAEKEMKRLLNSPTKLMMDTKMNMRAELFDRLDNAPKPNVEAMLDAWFNPQARMVMKMMVDSLSK